MHSKSFTKIVAAGFTFYRDRWDDEKGGSIWMAKQAGNWKLHLKDFKTKAALKRAMDDLINNDPFAITEH